MDAVGSTLIGVGLLYLIPFSRGFSQDLRIEDVGCKAILRFFFCVSLHEPKSDNIFINLIL